MIKNKAIEVIITFSEPELKEFYLFLESPYYNSNKSLIKLFGEIKKALSAKNSEKLTEEFLYGKIFKGKKYNYGIMKNLLSELFGLCEKFLAVHPHKEDPNIEFEESLRRLKNLNYRSLDKLFMAEYKRVEDRMEYSVLSTDYYRNKFRLVEAKYKFYTRRSKYSGAADTLYPMSIYNMCDIISMFKQDVAGMEYLENQLNTVPPVNVTDAFYRNVDFEKFLKEIKGLDAEHFDYINLQIRLMKLYNERDDLDNYYELKEFILGSM